MIHSKNNKIKYKFFNLIQRMPTRSKKRMRYFNQIETILAEIQCTTKANTLIGDASSLDNPSRTLSKKLQAKKCETILEISSNGKNLTKEKDIINEFLAYYTKLFDF